MGKLYGMLQGDLYYGEEKGKQQGKEMGNARVGTELQFEIARLLNKVL